jgi:U6 snRNA-associated Sm-like protein LSm8
LILDETKKSVFSSSQGIEQVVLGLHNAYSAGDNICLVRDIDEELDQRLGLWKIKAELLNVIPHGVGL